MSDLRAEKERRIREQAGEDEFGSTPADDFGSEPAEAPVKAVPQAVDVRDERTRQLDEQRGQLGAFASAAGGALGGGREQPPLVPGTESIDAAIRPFVAPGVRAIQASPLYGALRDTVTNAQRTGRGLQEEHPIAATAGGLAGSVPQMEALPVPRVFTSEGLAARAGQSAFGGGVYGALNALHRGATPSSVAEEAGTTAGFAGALHGGLEGGARLVGAIPQLAGRAGLAALDLPNTPQTAEYARARAAGGQLRDIRELADQPAPMPRLPPEAPQARVQNPYREQLAQPWEELAPEPTQASPRPTPFTRLNQDTGAIEPSSTQAGMGPYRTGSPPPRPEPQEFIEGDDTAPGRMQPETTQNQARRLSADMALRDVQQNAEALSPATSAAIEHGAHPGNIARAVDQVGGFAPSSRRALEAADIPAERTELQPIKPTTTARLDNGPPPVPVVDDYNGPERAMGEVVAAHGLPQQQPGGWRLQIQEAQNAEPPTDLPNEETQAAAPVTPVQGRPALAAEPTRAYGEASPADVTAAEPHPIAADEPVAPPSAEPWQEVPTPPRFQGPRGPQRSRLTDLVEELRRVGQPRDLGEMERIANQETASSGARIGEALRSTGREHIVQRGDVARAFREQPEVRRNRNAPPSTGLPDTLHKPAAALGEAFGDRGGLTPEQYESLRDVLTRKGKFDSATPGETTEPWRAARRALVNTADESLADLAPEHQSARRTYGAMSEVGEWAKDRQMRDVSNRIASPTDYAAGLGAEVRGGGMWGVPWAIANRVLRHGEHLGVARIAEAAQGMRGPSVGAPAWLHGITGAARTALEGIGGAAKMPATARVATQALDHFRRSEQDHDYRTRQGH